MVGRVNSGGGLGKLVTAYAEETVPISPDAEDPKKRYVTLTCDFDPLIIIWEGPTLTDFDGVGGMLYRLSRRDDWTDSSHTLAINNRTIKAGPFNGNLYAECAAWIRAWGLPD